MARRGPPFHCVSFQAYAKEGIPVRLTWLSLACILGSCILGWRAEQELHFHRHRRWARGRRCHLCGGRTIHPHDSVSRLADPRQFQLPSLSPASTLPASMFTRFSDSTRVLWALGAYVAGSRTCCALDNCSPSTEGNKISAGKIICA